MKEKMMKKETEKKTMKREEHTGGMKKGVPMPMPHKPGKVGGMKDC